MSRRKLTRDKAISSFKDGVETPAGQGGGLESKEVQSACMPSTIFPTGKFAWIKYDILGICALLAVLVFVIFGQTLNHGFFNYDDNLYVYENAEVMKGLTLCGVVHAFTRKELGLWSPIVTISHMLDWQLYGSKAGGHHLTNVLLHLASVILLFFILRQMTGAQWRSAFVAALFAVHPLHVESVAWISERKDMLCGFFFMLTLSAYLRYIRRPDSMGRYMVVILIFAVGLMCKPMLVTLPFVLILLDYWPLGRLFRSLHTGSKRQPIDWKPVFEKVPLLIISSVICLTILLGPKETGIPNAEHIPFFERICEAPVWSAIYLCQLIWPVGLAVIYPHPEQSLPWWPASLVLLASISIVVFHFRRKEPFLWIGWLWYLGMLVPVIGIVQISRHARADHYTYLPQIGLYMALTWGCVYWATWCSIHHGTLIGAGIVILCVLTITSYRQTSFWRDNNTLWNHTLECTVDNYLAHNNLGQALLDEGRTEEAIIHFRKALQIMPDYDQAGDNLGSALLAQGNTQEAVSQFRAVLRDHPADVAAHNNLAAALLQQGHVDESIEHCQKVLQIDPASTDALINLGNAFAGEGRTEEAIVKYHMALQINPAKAAAHNNLGSVLLNRRQLADAAIEFREALLINPVNADALCNLGIVEFQLGHTNEAIRHMEKSLVLQPGNGATQQTLAWMLATTPEVYLRDGNRAVELVTEASKSRDSGSDPNVLRTLAAAYAETGQFREAIESAGKALKLAEDLSASDLASALRHEIKLYEAGHRFEDAH